MRYPSTKAGRARARQVQSDHREASRLASLKAYPRQIVENILSRMSICQQVAARMVSHPGDTDAAIQFVAEKVGVPRETVRECLSIEALESGQ